VVKRQFVVSLVVSTIHTNFATDKMFLNVHNVEVQFFTKQLWSTCVIVVGSRAFAVAGP